MSAQEMVEAKSVPLREVELAAEDLPEYIAGLPRLLTDNLQIFANGTLTEPLNIHCFYGNGNIWVRSRTLDGLVLKGQVSVESCDVSVAFHLVEFRAETGKTGPMVSLSGNKYVTLNGCPITGNGSCDGILVSGGSAYILSTPIKNCDHAIRAYPCAFVSVVAETADFSGNRVGTSVYRGGAVILCDSTPDLLGGTTNAKAGGFIVKSNGTLL